MTNAFIFTLKRDKNRPKTWSILGGAAGDMAIRGQQRYIFLPVTVVGDVVLVKCCDVCLCCVLSAPHPSLKVR